MRVENHASSWVRRHPIDAFPGAHPPQSWFRRSLSPADPTRVERRFAERFRATPRPCSYTQEKPTRKLTRSRDARKARKAGRGVMTTDDYAYMPCVFEWVRQVAKINWLALKGSRLSV